MSRHEGHVWYDWPPGGCDEGIRLTDTARLGAEPYDVAIVGAGVVGCALAYELSQFQLRVILIEQKFDVGEGTSKANSAIIHTGFDAAPGTLESQLVSAASREWPAVADKLKVPMQKTGAVVLALDDEQARMLPSLHKKALDNGVDDVELIDAPTVRRLEPHAHPDVRGGLLVHRESVIDPFGTCVAYAEVALANGVDVLFGTSINGVDDCDDPIKTLRCRSDIRIPARLVVNAAGLWSRILADHYDGAPFDINPRRGQFLLYDKLAGPLVRHILLPIPTKRTKGMLVAPTIFGNILAGPTAEDLPPDALEATHTTHDGLAQVTAGATRLCPDLAGQPPIAAYAGLRCNCAQQSYLIRFNDVHPGFVTVTGVRSTGLTASFMLARHLIDGMADRCGLRLRPDPRAGKERPDSRWPGWWQPPFDDPARLAARPDYGRIVCSCENISRGEIDDALASPLHPQTLDALKRRTRVLMGRCQGFNCCVPVARAIQAHCRIPLHAVTKLGPGSEFIVAPHETADA